MSLDTDRPVLVVEGYQSLAVIMRNILKQIGFSRIVNVPDGSRALEVLHEENVGVILSELNVRPMSGLQLLREVRGRDELQHIPFMMLSAKTDVNSILAAKHAGVNAFLAKPFTTQVLVSHMDKIDVPRPAFIS